MKYTFLLLHFYNETNTKYGYNVNELLLPPPRSPLHVYTDAKQLLSPSGTNILVITEIFYFILLHFALLHFTDIAFFTN